MIVIYYAQNISIIVLSLYLRMMIESFQDTCCCPCLAILKPLTQNTLKMDKTLKNIITKSKRKSKKMLKRRGKDKPKK